MTGTLHDLGQQAQIRADEPNGHGKRQASVRTILFRTLGGIGDDNVKGEYSLILVAAGSAERPLARHLAAQSEGIVLIVGLNSTPRSAAVRAKRLLESTSARVLGAIVRV